MSIKCVIKFKMYNLIFHIVLLNLSEKVAMQL